VVSRPVYREKAIRTEQIMGADEEIHQQPLRFATTGKPSSLGIDREAKSSFPPGSSSV
jgi:hypothetical protein